MFIVTELIYLSYARSMDNLCVLLYDCIFNWNTRTSRVWQSIRDITAEKSKSCTFNAILRYTLTFLPACVFLLYTAHSNAHSVTCCSVPAFLTSREHSNFFRITLFLSSLCASLTCLRVCVVYFKGFSCFPRIYLAELLPLLHCTAKRVLVLVSVSLWVVTIVH